MNDRHPLAASPNPLPGIPHGAQIAAAAQRHHLDPLLLAAVAQQETQFGRLLDRSGRGDHGHGYGIFQLDDQRRHGNPGRPQAELDAVVRDPAHAADVAAQTLSHNLAVRHGNVREALQMYNTGRPDRLGTTARWPDGEVLHYADSVLRHERELRARIERGSPAPHAYDHLPRTPFVDGALSDPRASGADAAEPPPLEPGRPGATTATFIRNQHKLVITTSDGQQHAFRAANNVPHPGADPYAVDANGPAPDGRFHLEGRVRHDARHTKPGFGPVGFEKIDDPRGGLNERGIGLHSGRSGPEAKTHGCIRTTDDAMRLLAQHPAREITIEEGLTRPSGFSATGRIVRLTEDRVVQMLADGKTETYPVGELDRVPAAGQAVTISYGEHGATVTPAQQRQQELHRPEQSLGR